MSRWLAFTASASWVRSNAAWRLAKALCRREGTGNRPWFKRKAKMDRDFAKCGIRSELRARKYKFTGPSNTLPDTTSIRRQCWSLPNDRCSAPSSSTTIDGSLSSFKRSNPSAGRFTVSARTVKAVASIEADQKSRAPPAATLADSTKVQPPAIDRSPGSGHQEIESVRTRDWFWRFYRCYRLIAGITAQPFPHQSSTTKFEQISILRGVTPIAPCKKRIRWGHIAATAGRSKLPALPLRR